MTDLTWKARPREFLAATRRTVAEFDPLLPAFHAADETASPPGRPGRQALGPPGAK